MQANKYIAAAPTMQATQQQRMASVNQGVRANLINFQAAPPAPPTPSKKVAKTEGGEETRIAKIKTWVCKYGLLTVTLAAIAADHIKS